MNRTNVTTKEDGLYYVMNREKLIYKCIHFVLKSRLPNSLHGDLIFIFFQCGIADRGGSPI